MKAVVLSLAVLVGALIFSARADAITYGTPDGNGHPNVGALVAEFEPGQKDLLCSGTLISPAVFLTASHCTAFLESLGITDVWVTFDSQFDPTTSILLPGTYHTHPAFGRGFANSNDVAVVVLDSAVTGIAPAQLPTAGQFDEMAAKNRPQGQKFTAVGYGVQERQVGGGPPSFPFDGQRRVATSEFRAINKNWLRLSQNPSLGDGGTCFGDSGGPNFFGTSSIVAAVTVTGDTACRNSNVVYRLDTPSVRSFLDDFVTVP